MPGVYTARGMWDITSEVIEAGPLAGHDEVHH